MTTERFVVLGLAPARSSWFRDLSRWSNSAALPVEFLKTMSVEELRVRLRSGRGFSALLVDAAAPGLDRDLLELTREVGCAVIVIDSGHRPGAWSDLGASAVLPVDFGRDDLLQALDQFATPVVRPHEAPSAATPGPDGGYRGQLVAVTGAGGTGRSTVAMAVAQGLASDPRHAELVCLADLALHADQALLHDAQDVVPGLVELIEAHRTGSPTIDTIRSLTWVVDRRGYRLLLGLRRHRDWTAVRPRAFDAALDGLRRSFRIVVADIDDDLEGERATGSIDVEERNLMARTVAAAADLVVVVGLPDLHGVHGMLRVTRALLDHGVSGRRILPVVNRAPRGPRGRAELTRAYGELLAGANGAVDVPSPIFLADRRHLDELLRDGSRLPDGWLAPACGPVRALLDRELTPPEPRHDEPVPVAPGSLGAWTDQLDSDGGDHHG
jgi:hypothetical protein